MTLPTIPQSVTDARNATCTHGYNGRHQVTSATHSLAGQNTIALTYGYDAVGNRTSMTDGLGSVSYIYDQLSRINSESRTFNSLGSFTLMYAYNLANEVTSMADQGFSTLVGYSYDSRGRLGGVSSSGYPNVNQFASNFQYRAWDSLKGMTYGNGKTLSVGYNSRLLPTSYAIPGVMSKTYQYDNDARLDYSHDMIDARYDRKNLYDHVGRVQTSLSGAEARGEAATSDRPYNQTYGYDAWNNLTNRTGLQWSGGSSDAGSYTNNRRDGWSYDSDGNFLNDGSFNALQDRYDPAGQLMQIVHPAFPNSPKRTDVYDGDGQRVRTGYDAQFSGQLTYTYYLRSTVLGGQIVDEIGSNGQKTMSYVYHPSGGLMAVQKLATVTDVSNYVAWDNADASGLSVRMTDTAGNVQTNLSGELDPAGGDNAPSDPFTGNPLPSPPDETSPAVLGFGNPGKPSRGCTFNGIPLPDCGFLLEDMMNLTSSRKEPKLRSRSCAITRCQLTTGW